MWPALREHYLGRLQQHSDAEPAMIRILLQLHSDVLDRSSWATLWRSWITVVTFLGDYLLPFLSPLAPLLTGAFAEEHLSARERECLTSLSSPDWLRYVNTLEAQFRRLRDAKTDSEEAVRRQELVENLETLRRSVLAVGGTGLEPARLAHFLTACPANLVRTLKACVNNASNEHLPVKIELITRVVDVAVFCHEELLDNTLWQLIGNAATPKHRVAGQESAVVDLHIVVEPDSDDGVVRVFFRNTGTTPALSPGRGIASAQRKLRDFGGVLTPLATSTPWSYEVELCLKLW